MEIAIRVAQLILSMSLLIVLHELGHFLPAKWFKTRIEKFYLFFDPWFSLVKKKIGDTEYGIGWLPLGGYVRIAGMIDESMDTEQMKKPAEPWEFRSKPAWQRLIIMIGGVTVNIILGFIIFIGVFWYWGKDVIPAENLQNKMYVSKKMEIFGFQQGDVVKAVNGKEIDNPLKVNRDFLLRDVKNVTVLRQDNSEKVIAVPDSIGMYIWKNGIREQAFSMMLKNTTISEVAKNSPAEKNGLKKGDVIYKINNKEITSWNDFMETLAFSNTKTLDFEIKRGSEILTKKITLDDEGKLGVMPTIDITENENIAVHKNLSFGESVKTGVSEAYNLVHDFLAQFKYIFTKKGASQMGGFGTIAKLFGTSWDWHQFWVSTALISIMLGVMNLLPIPALDGGHIMFLLYEMITGRKPNEKFLEYAQIAGMLFLFALMLYANGMDIFRAIKN